MMREFAQYERKESKEYKRKVKEGMSDVWGKVKQRRYSKGREVG